MAQISPETVTLRKGCSSATAYLFGATLVSWKPHGTEALFVSKKSHFDNKKPIRGGVPVIFPQFGPWDLGPQHGFARGTKWSVKDGICDSKSDTVTFVLEDSEDTRKLWNFKFKLEYKLTLVLDSVLKMNVDITNTDNKSFDFTFLLHTYFDVPDVEKCTIDGLEGCSYIDKVNNGTLSVEENKEVMLSGFTDRIYKNTSSVIKLNHASANRKVTIEKFSLPDTVVWNPWSENAKKMEDFGDDEWKHMICIEAGHVNSPCTLKPGESFQASQLLSVN